MIIINHSNDRDQEDPSKKKLFKLLRRVLSKSLAKLKTMLIGEPIEKRFNVPQIS
jgi:hypothetical protein